MIDHQTAMAPHVPFSFSSVSKALLAAFAYAAITATLLNSFAGADLATPIWIPAGIGLGLLLIMGCRYWPFVLLGAFLGELGGGREWFTALQLAGGSTASFILATVLLLRLLRFDPRFEALRDYGLLVLAAFVSAILSTSINIQVLSWNTLLPSGASSAFYRDWFISDFFGMAFITPILLVLNTPIRESIPSHKIIPFIVFIALIFLLGQVIFFGWFSDVMGWAASRGNLFFIAIGLAAYFFGRHGAMLVFSVVLVQSMISTFYGDAFFGSDLLSRQAPMSVWFYLAFACTIGLAVSLVIQRFKRKNAELSVAAESIQKSAVLFRDMVEKIPVLMGIYDPKTDTTEYVNPYFTQVLGYSNLDFQGPGSWWLTAYPDLHYRTEVIAQWHEFTAGVSETKSTGRSLETWVQCKDGSKKRLSWGMFLVDQKMAIYALDITKRQHTERLLMTTSALYRAIGEAVIIADSSNTIVLVNDYFEKLTSFIGKEVVGTKFMDLLVKRHGARSYSDIISSLETAGHWEGQAWIKSRSGEETLQFVSIYSTFDEDGSIDQRVILISELTDQRKARALINQQANFDPLTDLPNRRLMSDRLEQLIKLASRANQHIAVIYLDLDNFKEVNDSRGHDFGDALLRVIAARLRAEVRESDTVARIGGDEFVVLLGGLERPENAHVIVQQMLKNISKPIEIDGHLNQITASFGVALFPTDGGDGKALILAADQAMYAAKAQGRNGHYYFTQALQTQASYRSRMISELRVALQEKQFELFYQPIVDIKTGAIAHAEVLLRWRKKGGALVTPGAFIEIAEDSGMLVEIGDWVMQQAIHFIRDLPRPHAISLAVNVSATQFNSDRHSVINWIDWMNEAGISPSSIVIEVTERLILLDSQRVQRKIKTLQESGCLFSVDDFGTGYSSLASLRNFNFDFIKIDRQFIHALSSMNEDEPLVSAMIAMAKGLKLQLIAEGVETEEQKVALIRMGCLYAQGYLYYKPMPEAEFKELLSNNYK